MALVEHLAMSSEELRQESGNTHSCYAAPQAVPVGEASADSLLSLAKHDVTLNCSTRPQNRKYHKFRLAVGSFIEEYANYVEIITCAMPIARQLITLHV